MTTQTQLPMPLPCAVRAERLRLYAAKNQYDGRRRDDSILARMLSWDSWAAHEFPRVAIADAADVALSHPELSDRVWHHTAGATILAGYCCGTPAGHRDALIALAYELTGEDVPERFRRVA